DHPDGGISHPRSLPNGIPCCRGKAGVESAFGAHRPCASRGKGMPGKTTTSRILESVDSRSRHLVQRLQKLQDIGTQLSAEQDLTKLLDLILRESRHLTNADAGTVFVRLDEVETVEHATGKDNIHKVTPFLVIKVAQNDSIKFPFKEMKLPFDRKTIAGHVAASGQLLTLAA